MHRFSHVSDLQLVEADSRTSPSYQTSIAKFPGYQFSENNRARSSGSATKSLRHSGCHSCEQRATPDRKKSQEDAKRYINCCEEEGSAPERGECFPLESGERTVRSDESNRDQEAPGRTQLCPLSQENQKESYQQARSHVDYKCTVGELSSHSFVHGGANPIASQRSQGASDCNQDIFLQMFNPHSHLQATNATPTLGRNS